MNRASRPSYPVGRDLRLGGFRETAVWLGSEQINTQRRGAEDAEDAEKTKGGFPRKPECQRYLR